MPDESAPSTTEIAEKPAEEMAEAKPNEHFNKLLQAAPEELRKTLLEAVATFAKANDPATGINDKTKSDKLRASFDQLQKHLFGKLDSLNIQQKVFLISGAIGDQIVATSSPVKLLEPRLYNQILKAVQETDQLPEWTERIYSTFDKYRALATGELTAYDPDAKRSKKGAAQKTDAKQIRSDLQARIQSLGRETESTVKDFDTALNRLLILRGEANIKNLRLNAENLKRSQLLLSTERELKPEEKKLKGGLMPKLGTAGKSLDDYLDKLGTTVEQIKKSTLGLPENLEKLGKAREDLEKMSGQDSLENSRKRFVSFDETKLDTIKRENDLISSFIVRASETSSQRNPFSSSRILNMEVIKHSPVPYDALCTPENVMQALKKITAIHTNLFPKDSLGNPIFPPFIIEPIRNYVEWFDDRFIISFVSGEGARKGSLLSFSSAEMQVLKACGVYLAKDPIYDYRGEPATGTFMGDYAGQVEKKAAVKWAGEDKKFSIVSASSVTDGASRDEAAGDYMDFLFQTANGLPPSSRLSQRKKAVILKYVELETPEKTIGLVLRLIAQQDPLEAREIILKYANRSTDRGKELIQEAFKVDQQAAKQFSNNPAYIIKRVFGS